jgi:membrane-associated phospholipid phosphatase
MTTPAWPALPWALVVALFSAGIPMRFITKGAQDGRYDTHHVNNREGRTAVLLVCLLSTAAGLAILLLGSAPRADVVMTVVMLAVLLGTGLVTVVAKWKISMHAAVSAGSVAMLAFLYGPWAWTLLLLVAIVCWSRVVLRDHTTGQVSAGAATGAATAIALFATVL